MCRHRSIQKRLSEFLGFLIGERENLQKRLSEKVLQFAHVGFVSAELKAFEIKTAQVLKILLPSVSLVIGNESHLILFIEPENGQAVA